MPKSPLKRWPLSNLKFLAQRDVTSTDKCHKAHDSFIENYEDIQQTFGQNQNPLIESTEKVISCSSYQGQSPSSKRKGNLNIE